VGPVRRLAVIACLTVPLAPASAAAAQDRPPPQARLISCTTGDTAGQRTAAFMASMPAIDGSTRMAVRFDLFERRAGDAEFRRVRLPAWGRWERSDPDRTGFIYTKRVRGLRAPAAYRARVRFRWYGPDGRLVRRATRLTPVCREPAPAAGTRSLPPVQAGGDAGPSPLH
jgi:hypothetical protein